VEGTCDYQDIVLVAVLQAVAAVTTLDERLDTVSIAYGLASQQNLIQNLIPVMAVFNNTDACWLGRGVMDMLCMMEKLL
jgi:hypothetical protein